MILHNRTLATEDGYPYKAVDNGICMADWNASTGAITVTGYEQVPQNNERALLRAVANQPVSVYIDAEAEEFKYYSGGLYKLNSCCYYVGYNTTQDDGTKYWLVKNS
ncbi:hypothetical protein PRUPE_4G153900 [Prunus persica]|uniref:Peptidase C1A papain C-terminal domain-containing protein n=1 Tax=Prunus persica TaxID=3760 RepID=M5WIQ8_PRUPE|nr:vignain [Prunus persica]ONI12251.1 hypothetical protein PRUPE_4G153900 [Prunus persica]